MERNKAIDLTRIKPYGDTLNDGKIQISFTLPVEDGEKAVVAAKNVAERLGLEDPNVVYHKKLDVGFTFFIIYGHINFTIDYKKIKTESVEVEKMTIQEINEYIRSNIKRKVIVLGATTGTDAHTVGISAIISMKGYAGHKGLESYEMIDAYNLGSQISNEEFIKKAIEMNAEVLLVSQTVTQKNIHIKNLTNLVELLEAEGIRDKIILICGGPRVSNELAKELGYDAGFGPETYAETVASYFIKEIVNRQQ
ncbi:MAG: OAM dimerization domain-containing protein [Promethearchaeota archaeon]